MTLQQYISKKQGLKIRTIQLMYCTVADICGDSDVAMRGGVAIGYETSQGVRRYVVNLVS